MWIVQRCYNPQRIIVTTPEFLAPKIFLTPTPSPDVTSLGTKEPTLQPPWTNAVMSHEHVPEFGARQADEWLIVPAGRPWEQRRSNGKEKLRRKHLWLVGRMREKMGNPGGCFWTSWDVHRTSTLLKVRRDYLTYTVWNRLVCPLTSRAFDAWRRWVHKFFYNF